ncbi:MAG: bifunctional DNA-formamidopyrimidine glycosylase/DNA-(apurinic or apyrimidinic site) lyase [Desulfobacterales bacterium]|nr:bifunctional DNA-formamidopyrimidine glycosylase/DNA-(apurinic or apyrimidinic site) lyase [Desulfobacterales bacterium]
MPELPEVQTIVNDLLTAGLVGAEITGARVFWPRTISGMSPAAFGRRVKGRVVTGVWRRAKYIVVDLDGGLGLLIHLRMTGRLDLVPARQPRAKHEHVILELGDQRHLRFHDTRKFGRFCLTAEPGKILDRLGPEPLSAAFTARRLADCLKARRRMVKPLLLDQRMIAGLGNIYADEALWAAGIHPGRMAGTLLPAEIKALHRAIRQVLAQGVKNLGTTLGSGAGNFYSIARHRGRNRDALKVFRRDGLPCPRCAHPIRRIVVGQRGTHFCPVCQQ